MTSMYSQPNPNEPTGAETAPARRIRRTRVLSTVAVVVVLVVGLFLTYFGTRVGEDTAIAPAPAQGPSDLSVAPDTTSQDGRMAGSTLTLGPIGVDAPIVSASVIDGVLTPPIDVREVGLWLDGAPLSSVSGTTLLAGHVNLVGQGNGALFDLGMLKPGQEIRTSDVVGNVTRWRVMAVVSRPKAAGIEESVLAGPEGRRKLAVVTCGGELQYIDGVGSYADNVYLYADPI